MAGGGLIVLFRIVFWWRGAQLGRKKRIRGAEMVTATELRRRVQPPHHRALGRLQGGKRLQPYSIAGIPYPERTETQHTVVSGTTGSGKTVLISDLAAQIRERGERCVIYDKMGSYTRAFFHRNRDVLMNPLDARAPRWSPFLEARNPRDFDMMAAALIPQQKDTVDPFWATAARQLFSNGAGVLRQRGVKDKKVLVDHLLKTDLTALAQPMEGTVAQSIVDPENPKTALSVRAMLTANLSALEFLPDNHRLTLVPAADRHDGAVPAGRPVAVAQILADVAYQYGHGHAVAAGGAVRAVARHPEYVPQAPALVLETLVPLGQGDQAVPNGTRDRDGNLEARLAGGVGDVDEDAVLDRLGAGVGEDHGTECGGVGGLGHGRVSGASTRGRRGRRRASAWPRRGSAPARRTCATGHPPPGGARPTSAWRSPSLGLRGPPSG